jgi:SAM-dependent methyltransferase
VPRFPPPVDDPTALRRVRRGLRRLLRPRPGDDAPGEKTARWYDAVYERSENYRRHYTASEYYFLWAVIADRISSRGVRSVLDIGCGPGQFASLLRDRGIRDYCGFDLSPRSIEIARSACPEFEFSVADALQTDLLESRPYDCVVSCEFLEHVERELDVLRRIRPATRFFGTVPNFASAGHVRSFESTEDVERRYGPLFAELRVDVFRFDARGKVFYLCEGLRAG